MSQGQSELLWVPFEIAKGHEEGGPRIIEGIISSETIDADGEIVLQNGLDFSYFLERGWLNDNHDQGAGAGIGFPLSIDSVTLPNGRSATRMRAEMFDTPEATKIWNLVKAAKGKRKMGFSIEGSIKRRLGAGGKTVANAQVRDCSITRHPKNPDATLSALVKALGPNDPTPDWAGDIRKAMNAGEAGPTVSDDGGLVGTPGGHALVPQSNNDSVSLKDRGMSEAKAVQLLARRLGINEASARVIYRKLASAKKRKAA